MRAPLAGEPMTDKLQHRYFQIQPVIWSKDKALGTPIGVSTLGVIETYADPTATEPSYWDVCVHWEGCKEANIAVCGDAEGARRMADLVAQLLGVEVGSYWELRKR